MLEFKIQYEPMFCKSLIISFEVKDLIHRVIYIFSTLIFSFSFSFVSALIHMNFLMKCCFPWVLNSLPYVFISSCLFKLSGHGGICLRDSSLISLTSCFSFHGIARGLLILHFTFTK